MTGSSAAKEWPPIPDRRFFRIGEAARLVGVKAHVLRYWESEFAEIRPKKTKSRQRIYRRADIEALRLIAELIHDRGLTHEGARKHLREHGLATDTGRDSAQHAVDGPADSERTGADSDDLVDEAAESLSGEAPDDDASAPVAAGPSSPDRPESQAAPTPEARQSTVRRTVTADEENDILRTQVARLREQLGGVTEDSEGLRARMSALQLEIEDLRSNSAPELADLRTLLEKEVERLTRDLTEARWTEEQLRLELANPPQVKKLERELEETRRTTQLPHHEIETQRSVTSETADAVDEERAESQHLEERIRGSVPDAEYVERLENEMSELRGSIAPLQAGLTEALAEAERVTKLVEAGSPEELEALRRDLSVAQDTAESLRLQLEAREDASIASELSDTVEAAEEARANTSEIEGERDSLLMTVAELRAAVKKAEADKDRLHVRLANLETSSGGGSAEVKALKERLDEALRSANEANRQAESSESERKDAMAKVEEALRERDVTARLADQAREDAERVVEELEGFRTKTQRLEGQSADERMEAEGLRVELEETHRTLVAGLDERSKVDGELKQAGRDIAELRASVEELEERSSVDRAEVERLTTELGANEESLEEQRTITQDVSQELVGARGTLSRLEVELSDERTVSEQLQDELDRVQRQIYDLSTEVEAQKARAEASESAAEDSERLRGEVEELQTSTHEVSQELDGTRGALSRLEVELSNERTVSGRLQDEFDRMQHHIYELSTEVEAQKARAEASESAAEDSEQLRGEVEELRMSTAELHTYKTDHREVARLGTQLRSAVLRLLDTVEDEE